MELGAVVAVVTQGGLGDIEVKRATGYFLALIAETAEFHQDLDREGGVEAIIQLASMEDIECQEYAAFSLAHLASNKELQVRLVALGALRPLVSMMAVDAEPKHYAGLALLKLADNFENHLKIAEEGGIQALLRLGRSRSTDEELQYKAALTVGHLASNAVKMLPPSRGGTRREIGFGASVLQGSTKGKKGDKTTGFLATRLINNNNDGELMPGQPGMMGDDTVNLNATSAASFTTRRPPSA